MFPLEFVLIYCELDFPTCFKLICILESTMGCLFLNNGHIIIPVTLILFKETMFTFSITFHHWNCVSSWDLLSPWWRHQMETFSALPYRPFVRGIHRSPVVSTHKGQWRGALMFSLICAWTNDWANNEDAGDLDAIAFIMTSLQWWKTKHPMCPVWSQLPYGCCLRRQFLNNHNIDLLFNEYSSFMTKRFTLITLWAMNVCFYEG